MSSLTIHHYLDIIDSFVRNLTSSSKSYYVFIGRPYPWTNAGGSPDDAAVPSSNDSVYQHESSVYTDMAFGKLIANNNVSYMIPRYDWTRGTIYDQYDQFDGNLIGKRYYVMNDNYEVYKVVDNNNGAASVVKPTLTIAHGTFTTSDGYVWKFMYKVGALANTSFTSSAYIPVTPDTYVTSNAVPGSIDSIRLVSAGNNYQTYYTGYLRSSVDNYTLVIDNNASPLNDYYTGSSIYLKSGFGAGQIRRISRYDGATRTVRTISPFDTYITFNLSSITGSFPVGSVITQNIDSISLSYQVGPLFQVGDNVVQSETGANGIVVSANSTNLRLIRASDAAFTNAYPINNLSQSGSLGTGTVSAQPFYNLVISPTYSLTLDPLSVLTMSSNTGAFTLGESIIQMNGVTPVANGYLYRTTSGSLSVRAVQGTFVTTYQVKGMTSLANAVISVASITGAANSGAFTVGETLQQTSDGTTVVANGVIYSVSSSTVRVANVTGAFTSSYQIKGLSSSSNGYVSAVAQSGTANNLAFTVGEHVYQNNATITIANGVVFAINGSNVVLANVSGGFVSTYQISGLSSTANAVIANVVSNTAGRSYYYTSTDLSGSYSYNNYIRIGSDANNNIRRILGVNSTVITVDSPLSASVSANTHYKMPSASEILDITYFSGNGTISNTNLDGSMVTISNSQILGRIFTIGESVTMVDLSGVAQGKSAVVSYANSSTVVTTGMNPTGASFDTGYYLLGGSSLQRAYISGVVSYPNVTVKNPTKPFGGFFLLGQPIKASDALTMTSTYGTANVVSYYQTPNELTEFVISPTVNITGDGQGALAYAAVNSTILTISSNTGQMAIGELLYQLNSNGNISAKGIIEFANTSTIKINQTVGSWSNAYQAKGELSLSNVVVSYITPSNNISQIVMVNPGTGYTYANINITANATYGTGANAYPNISPAGGHGYNTYAELGAKYVGITLKFDNAMNELYKFPVNGQYRRIGIIENPLFEDVIVNMDSFDRSKLALTNKNSFSFVNNEIVIQPSTNAAGLVVYGNNTFLELKNVRGTFSYGSAAANIYALSSGTTANVVTANVNRFAIITGIEIASEANSNVSGLMTQIISDTSIKLTNVSGKFDANDVIYENATNAYANVSAIYTSNGVLDSTHSFGLRFNQLCRLPITANNKAFTNYEKLSQTVTSSNATIIDIGNNADIKYTGLSGSGFSPGETITDSTSGASGIILSCNSTYIRITGKTGNYSIGDTIINNLGSSATITDSYIVLLLSDVYGKFVTGINSDNFIGATSGAIANCTIENVIVYPELVRDSGVVTYLENMAPFALSNTSTETVKLVIKF
jgi:hypothetical protein